MLTIEWIRGPEAEEKRLRLQFDAKEVPNALPNIARQREQLIRAAASVVDEGECVR